MILAVMYANFHSVVCISLLFGLPLERTSTPIQQCLQDLVDNSEMGRLLDETQLEGYEEAAVLRYLHDFVHMVHKSIVPEEEKVGHLSE